MWFDQAVNKLASNTCQAYNPTKAKWETLPFKIQLANSGRWIGRTESFYNRRVILTPEVIDPKYQVIRLGKVEFLLFANQPNIQQDDTYLYDYTGLNIEPSYATLTGLTPTLSASGVSGTKTVVSLGSFPVAMDRFASSGSVLTRDVNQSKMNCYIPTYSNAVETNLLTLAGEQYGVKESFLELNLLHLTLVKR